MVSITDKPIDPSTVIQKIATRESGAVDVFVGLVRNHTKGKRVRQLEYSAYVPMAEKLMSEIEGEMRNRWTLHEVVLAHRIGVLDIGDVAVVTAVSSSHRADAFEACRHAIERIKAIVPIWKKEFFEEGMEWVEGGHEWESR